MPNTMLGDLIGTLRDYFRIGKAGPRLKNNAGVLEVRNSGDSADANAKVAAIVISGGTPTAGKVLTAVDVNGNTQWSSPSSVASRVQRETFTQATASPLTIYTPQNGEIIEKVVIEITTAAAGGSPTLAVGRSGQTAEYMATSENNVNEVGVYEVTPMISNAGNAVILTIVVSGQTFVGSVSVWGSVPS
jgi:type IV secretory pathway VirJ component